MDFYTRIQLCTLNKQLKLSTLDEYGRFFYNFLLFIKALMLSELIAASYAPRFLKLNIKRRVFLT